MSTISKNDMLNLASLLGDSYSTVINSYGDDDTPGTAIFDIAKAKSFVRGGTESNNGVRASRLSGASVLDLAPSVSGTDLTVRRGRFFVNGMEKELVSDVVLDCDAESATFYTGSPDDNSITAWANSSTLMGLVFATMDPITSDTVGSVFAVTSGSGLNTNSTGFELNGTTTHLSQAIGDTKDGTNGPVTIDEVQLYLGVSGLPNVSLYVDVYSVDTSSGGDKQPTGSALATSVAVQATELTDAPGWVSFPLTTRIDLDNTTTNEEAQAIVLRYGAAEVGTTLIDSSNKVLWFGEVNSALTPAAGSVTWDHDNEHKATSSDGSTWSFVSSGHDAGFKLINYVKATWQAESSFGGVLSTLEEWLSTVSPDTAHARVAEIALRSDGSGVTQDLALTDSSSASYVNDVREITGYAGLEDDDQMGDLFPSIDTTENTIISSISETGRTGVAQDYSAIVSALGTHISNTAGMAFKAYWKNNNTQFDRNFRKLWYINGSEELSVNFGTRWGSEDATAYQSATSWVYNSTYAANMTVGGNLEIILSEGSTTTWPEENIYVYAIRPTWTTLAFDIDAGSAFLPLSSVPSTFQTLVDGSTASYVWVEHLGQPEYGELLQIDTWSYDGHIANLASVTDQVAGVTSNDFLAGTRVYLVDRITVAVGSDLSTTEEQTIDPAASGRTYIGVAYVNATTSTPGSTVGITARLT